MFDGGRIDERRVDDVQVQAENDGPIKIIRGSTDILLIAPHACIRDGESKDDENTRLITEKVAQQLGCSAIINTYFHKPKRGKYPYGLKYGNLNLNVITHAMQVKVYREAIRAVINEPGKTMVFWVHGADDNKAIEVAKEHKYAYQSGEIEAFIGYGQRNKTNPTDSFTAKRAIVKRFCIALNEKEMKAVITKNGASNYCGRSEKGMNQWFKKNKCPHEQVESIQLEIRMKGFRENPEQCQNTAKIIADAISAMLEMSQEISERAVVEKHPAEETVASETVVETQADKALAEEAFQWLAERFKEHVTDFMYEAGKYIIDTFYGGNPRVAFAKNKSKEQPPSLHLLIQKIKKPSENFDGDAPSISWFYKAVSLAAHEMICEQMGLSTFTNLRHSHKLQLLNVPKTKGVQKDKLDEVIKSAFVEKDRLASEAVVKDLSVRNFKKYIDTEHPNENGTIDLINLPPRDALINLGPAYLTRLYNSVRTKIEEGQSDLKAYGKSVDNLGAALSTFQGENIEGGGKFRDWTDAGNNVNICTGCKNDCLYCYMKPMNARNPEKRKQSEDWHNFELRDHNVEEKQKLYSGLVGFPSSHDIFPDILDAYLIVLGKLLRASNEVLIVSKPRLDCISRICEAAEFFKDRILFRFTIGAMSDDLLGYWEPHAPDYSERKECLEYAFNRGFRTSVSSEPLLDRNNAEILEADLMPFITEDMWFGKMSYISFLRKGANAELNKRLDQIEQGQTQDKRDALREVYKGNDKVKFKTGW